MRRQRPLVERIEKRKRKLQFHPDEVRAKIQAHRLVEILQKFIFSEVDKKFIFSEVDKNGQRIADLSMPQVRAIDCLLKKCVPDLTRTLISADVNVRYVAELPKVLTKEEGLRKYGPEPLELAALPAPVNSNGHSN
jgi:hypothetical protein